MSSGLINDKDYMCVIDQEVFTYFENSLASELIAFVFGYVLHEKPIKGKPIMQVKFANLVNYTIPLNKNDLEITIEDITTTSRFVEIIHPRNNFNENIFSFVFNIEKEQESFEVRKVGKFKYDYRYLFGNFVELSDNEIIRLFKSRKGGLSNQDLFTFLSSYGFLSINSVDYKVAVIDPDSSLEDCFYERKIINQQDALKEIKNAKRLSFSTGDENTTLIIKKVGNGWIFEDEI